MSSTNVHISVLLLKSSYQITCALDNYREHAHAINTIHIKAQFFFHFSNYFHQTQYWLSLRVGVGDRDVREVLIPAP